MGIETITKGTIFLLPINVPGALLAMGYLHAGMSGGEVGISGLEIKGVMEVEVSVIKSHLYPLPLAVHRLLYTIASSPDLGQTTETATLMATGLLTAHGGLDTNQAIALQSIAGDLQICQVVDPNKTCCFAIPRTVTEQLRMERMEFCHNTFGLGLKRQKAT
ncbi:acetamidase/formamidase family protein [Eikenella exigua]|uniref:acetamidase/formamidase family protein n=1 Tax=Eikenella exigua TaxID=2528037 RepID=UPI00129A462C|nr:acetamidase/formamidase family protein [Eikenella exigua]